ncbi:MAG: phage holin family protein [Bernardetiaceae bacterium]|nr:phage holin family protein [Bernardetiaceae bacterium]
MKQQIIKEILKRLQLESALDSVRAYLNVQLEIIKLSVAESGAKAILSIIKIVVLLLFGFFAILFLSLMVAFGLNAWLKSSFWGFGIVAGFYTFFILLFMVLQKPIQSQIERKLESKLKTRDLKSIQNEHKTLKAYVEHTEKKETAS